eukprot:26857_1
MSAEEEDSDLEIIPNPPSPVNIVDLSEELNDELPQSPHSVTEHESIDDAPINNNNGKRRIKPESVIDESPSVPPAKRRRLNNNNNHDDDECDGDEIINIKREKEIKLAEKSIDINKQKTTTCSKANKYHFYGVSDGLNYSGQCLNNECTAYKEPIAIWRGFGEEVVPIKDEKNNFMKCPGCSNIFILKAIVLYNGNA